MHAPSALPPLGGTEVDPVLARHLVAAHVPATAHAFAKSIPASSRRTRPQTVARKRHRPSAPRATASPLPLLQQPRSRRPLRPWASHHRDRLAAFRQRPTHPPLEHAIHRARHREHAPQGLDPPRRARPHPRPAPRVLHEPGFLLRQPRRPIPLPAALTMPPDPPLGSPARTTTADPPAPPAPPPGASTCARPCPPRRPLDPLRRLEPLRQRRDAPQAHPREPIRVLLAHPRRGSVPPWLRREVPRARGGAPTAGGPPRRLRWPWPWLAPHALVLPAGRSLAARLVRQRARVPESPGPRQRGGSAASVVVPPGADGGGPAPGHLGRRRAWRAARAWAGTSEALSARRAVTPRWSQADPRADRGLAEARLQTPGPEEPPCVRTQMAAASLRRLACSFRRMPLT
jgi:hypothetical protein